MKLFDAKAQRPQRNSKPIFSKFKPKITKKLKDLSKYLHINFLCLPNLVLEAMYLSGSISVGLVFIKVGFSLRSLRLCVGWRFAGA